MKQKILMTKVWVDGMKKCCQKNYLDGYKQGKFDLLMNLFIRYGKFKVKKHEFGKLQEFDACEYCEHPKKE